MKPNLYICHTAYQVLVDLLRASRTDGQPHTMVLSAAVPEPSAGSAEISRAELARALNSLLGRQPDTADAQLRAAAWYQDNQDETAWYYADLIEASVDHTCRYPAAAERWTAIG